MTEQEIKKEIRRLCDERDALLLAHNYQRDEVQEIADITGDSLGLSMEAANTDKQVIVFCGVHFMAESAAILAPQKTVLLPRADSGCPMADMVTAEGLRDLKRQHPDATVVTYVNSSAAVKAESDICCTSSNAVNVARSLETKKLLLVPDRNLGRYIASHLPDKECICWEGYCPTHDRLKVADIEQARADHPDALFMAHPECTPEILELADHICSTSGMYEYARSSEARKFIVGTEMGILYRLRKENPDKEFILPSQALICPNMKLTNLEDILRALQTLEPRITVAEEVRVRAKMALDRMLAVPRD
ncbi:quinolinate synthase NadA [Geothermobacter hydrogeniphilus]|uniref:Quinolinate synthase n=1 Tax=Geothermobacter hydrogeniphilus TaxID=1969733 RepID=A0A1X0XZK2_9BACT|nr:quinolinate synthase NadA [Geothermobacter hydrogeniphilus]ORJ58279.1 quinolinate synthase [Geothermobacter hydrogeniphilus]